MASNVGIFKPHTSGLKPSKDTPTVIFLCGFPDLPEESWSRVAPQFEETHHVVTMGLPDYGETKLRRFWGYSMEEIVKGLAVVMETHYKRGSPIHLVGHDWGAWIGLMFANSEYAHMVNKMVVMDVGIRSSLSLIVICYMSFLALVFLVSRISDVAARILLVSYPWKLMGPTPYETSTPIRVKKVRAFWTYPYLQVFFSKAARSVRFNNDLPQLYLYGAKKRTQFHSEKFLEKLESSPHCRYKQFDGGAHWFHWTMADQVGSEIKSFLTEQKK